MNEFQGLEITTPHQETWRKQKKPHNAGTWKPPPPQVAFGNWTFQRSDTLQLSSSEGTMERHTAVTYLDPNCLKLIVYLILDGTSSRYDHSFQATHMVLSPKDLALLLGNDPRIYFLKYLHMVFGKEWTGKTDEDLGHSPGAKAPRQLSSTGISI